MFSGDESDHVVNCWDTRTGALLKKLGGHGEQVVYVASSSIENAFVSCGEDSKARLWFSEK